MSVIRPAACATRSLELGCTRLARSVADARALVSTACLTATAVALVQAPGQRSLWLLLGILGAYASLSLVWRQRGDGARR